MYRIPQRIIKSVGTLITRPYRSVCRHISGMPKDNQTNGKTNMNNKDKSATKDVTDNRDKKKSCVSNYGSFLTGSGSDIKVCIIGGGMSSIYTAVLLKQSRIVERIHLVDPQNSMAACVLDASHIDTTPRIKYFKLKNIKEALKEMNIIALMDEKDVNTDHMDPVARFNAASNYVFQMTEQMVQFSPNSLVIVFIRPVTATLVMVSEIYKSAGWWDPDRIIGSTAIDCMRMEAITARFLGLNPAFLSLPLVGGADPDTIVPLFSCARPVNWFTDVEKSTLLNSLRRVDEEIANVEPTGPTLSAGAAAAKLILKLAGGLSGFKNVVGCGFVRSNVLPVCQYFASKLQFGPGGVQKNFGLPKISHFEVSLVEQSIPFINAYVEMAKSAVRDERSKSKLCKSV